MSRIGTDGRELVEEFAGENEAGQALEAVAQAKQRRGYRDLSGRTRIGIAKSETHREIQQ